MKTNLKTLRRAKKRGLSLIETTAALFMAMALAAATIILMQQHIQFMKVVNQFSFLRDEAPLINVLMSRIIQRSDAYRIFAGRQGAINGGAAVNTDGKAVWLRFRNPDGTFQQSIIAFDDNAGDGRLNYYVYDGNSWPATPDWTISSLPENVSFSNDTGVLLMTVTGPSQEEITYVGYSE